MIVKVNTEDEDLLINPMLKPYNGQMFKVSKTHRFKNSTYFFELHGAESKHGIPYSFCREWLEMVMRHE